MKNFFFAISFFAFFCSFAQNTKLNTVSVVGTTNTPENPITGTLTINYLSKATGNATLGNSSIYDNGNVGIGTTSPLKKFHVQAGGTSLLTSAFGDGMVFSSNSTSGTRFFIEHLAAPVDQKTSVIYSENGLFILGGVLSDNGGTWKQPAPIVIKNATGFVGINTKNPLYNLDVNGQVRVTSNLIASSFVKQGGTAKQFLKADGSVDNIVYAPLVSPSLSGIPVAPTATPGMNTTQIATTAFVSNALASVTIPDATNTIKGKIKLAGDLGGTADAPTVPSLANKENTITSGTISQYWRGDKTWQNLDKTAVGLSNVDNTSDANKPISTATQTALDSKQATLVSGTSIKTINGNSLLGSGDITISSGGSTDPLEFNATDRTVWNNGKGDIISNTSFGDSALRSNTTGNNNTAFGVSTLSSNTTGNWNTAFGINTLRLNNTGVMNTGFGWSNLENCTTGSLNTAVGMNSLRNLTTGLQNTALGQGSLQSNTIGRSNVGIGSNALQPNTTGSYNIAIGELSGADYLGGNFNNINSSIYIGRYSSPYSNGVSNEVVIGNDTKGAGSNTATLGNTSITKTILRGEVQGGSFKKLGGTSSQYLMADGSVSTGASGEPVITTGTTSQYWRGDKTWQILDKASVGLGNIDNTTDANKPISTATQLALDGKQNTLTNPITGTGTTNYISKFTATGTLSNSAIYDNGGNVGIGTTVPDAKLAVKGQIHAQEVKVDLQGAMVPDYVFGKNYNLKSLSEVDAYIKANSHLPEVPSAQEIEKNGLQLGEMNMVLLKKIEELTLHAIEQQKQIESLKKENENYKTLSERMSELEKKIK